VATFSYITLGTAKQQLANRLFDPSMQFWSAAELTSLINEALQTWNALTSYFRAEFIFDTVANTTFYDLTTQGGSLRVQSTTGNSLASQLEYSLLEPQALAPAPWTGSNQFTLDNLANAIQHRRDELLAATGCQLTRSTVPAVPGRIQLADSVIDVRRVAYLPVSPGNPNVLFLDDSWSEQAYNRGYTIAGPGSPTTYLQSTEPPLSFDVNCPPYLPGVYELLTVNAGTVPIDLTATLPLPNDWCWVVRWGALASLLSHESYARDPLRAQYARQRYLMGTEALKMAPAVISARLANVPLQVDGIQGADNYRTGWQGETAARPDTMLTAGLNLAAFAPKPNGVYSVTCSMVENAPLPAGDSSPLQVARDVLEAVLAYAQHVAAFKQGGAEFQSTLPLFKHFMEVAGEYNSRLTELGEYTDSILGLSQRFESLKPRLSESLEEAAQ